MTQANPFLLRTLLTELPRYAYSFTNETDLHRGIEMVLATLKVPYQREFAAGPHERFDFLLEGGIVIEAKIKGTAADAVQQCARYCERADVAGVVLVAAKAWAVQLKPTFKIKGKPVAVVHVRRQAF